LPWNLFPNVAFLCIIPGYRGIRWLKTGDYKMRKVALLAAVLVAAAFSSTSNVAVAQGQDLNPNTTKFLQDAVNPYVATAKPAAPAMKAHKKMKKAKK
jgi:hypothetical protein